MKKIETLTCCGQELKYSSCSVDENAGYQVIFYTCQRCGKYIKMYPSQEQSQKLDDLEKDKILTDFLIKELRQRGYHVFKDKEYKHHEEALLRELQCSLADLEIKILGEIKGEQAIIYLESDCYPDLMKDEENPIKLPLLQLPANTKNIKYFDYLTVD